jgi:hypothetical protein
VQTVMRPRLRSWYRSLADTLIRGSQKQIDAPSKVLAPRACPTFQLEQFPDATVLQPGLRFYLGLFDRKEGFAFVKRTHGFWDGLVYLREAVPEIDARVVRGEPVTSEMVRVALSDIELAARLERRSGYDEHYRDHFWTELVEDLQNPHRMPAYIEANSFRGYPNSLFPALNPVDRLREVYHSFHTSGRPAHDAQVWKQSILDGRFRHLVRRLRRMTVVVIGPSHLSGLESHYGLRSFQHIVIPITGAPRERRALLQRCSTALQDASQTGRPTAVLYQAGALAFWLIYRLFPVFPAAFHLDLGRCLDVWFPEVVSEQPWFIQNREQSIAKLQLEHLYH